MIKKLQIGEILVWGLNIVFVIINALNITTPILAANNNILAGFLYLIFRPTCHQIAHRSYFFHGHQFAVCARCTGIWLSAMICGFIMALILRKKNIKPISIKWFIISLIPLVIDGSFQFAGFYESTNTIRLITGILASAGTVLYAFPRLWTAREV